jgi:hypothetical protein
MQHHRAAAFVIAQQYSSATFVSLPLHSSQEKKIGVRFKNVISIFFTF